MYSLDDYYLLSGTFKGMEFISEAIADSWLTALEEWFKQPNRLSLSSIDLLLSNYDENNIPCCHEASVLFRQLVSSSSLSPSIAKHVFTPTVTKQLIATISLHHTLFASAPPKSQDLLIPTLENTCSILSSFFPSRQSLLSPAIPALITWLPTLLHYFDPAGPAPLPAILLLRHLHFPRDTAPVFLFSLLRQLFPPLLRSSQRAKLLSSLLLFLPVILRVFSNGEFQRSLHYPIIPRLLRTQFPWFP